MIVQTGVKFNSEHGLEIPPDLRLYDVLDTHMVEKLVNEVEREHIRQIIQQVTGCKFSNEHLDALEQISVRLLATFKERHSEKKDDEFKQVMKEREVLANKLLNAMNNGKVYFRWVDIENSEWQELTAYSLLANTFENAEFKFETIISHNDIVKGKV